MSFQDLKLDGRVKTHAFVLVLHIIELAGNIVWVIDIVFGNFYLTTGAFQDAVDKVCHRCRVVCFVLCKPCCCYSV